MTVNSEVEAEIKRLFFVEHWPVGTIARQLEVHDDVVRRVTGLLSPRRVLPPRAPSPVAPYEGFIAEQLAQWPTLRATRLYDMARERGYTGSVGTLREHVALVRPRRQREVYLRVEPLIGEQSQIDWAHAGDLYIDGTKRTLWLFLIVLAWSRAMWGEFVLELSASSLARSLTRATAFFEGTTRQWLFDNPKNVVTERHGDRVRFHSQLAQLAAHYRVQARVCGVRKPNQKGRVERAIRYVRERFLAGRFINNVQDGNLAFLDFIEHTAHARPHPTLTGRTVASCFAEERGRLLAPPRNLPCTDVVLPVVVDKTAFVRFESNAYSVPPAFAQGTLTIAADDFQVRCLDQGVEVARHPRCFGKKRVIEDPAHRRALVEQKRGARESKGRDRLQLVTPHIDILYERWFNQGCNLGSMTTKVLRILDLYGAEIFSRAIDDVVAQDLHDPGAISIVCERLRKEHDTPVPIEPVFGKHVTDREIVPHDLEGYDARRRR
jgi:transposase